MLTSICSCGSQARAFVGALKPTYWQALIVVCVIYFTRFDWSFVVLRAKQVGPSAALSQLGFCTRTAGGRLPVKCAVVAAFLPA